MDVSDRINCREIETQEESCLLCVYVEFINAMLRWRESYVLPLPRSQNTDYKSHCQI